MYRLIYLIIGPLCIHVRKIRTKKESVLIHTEIISSYYTIAIYGKHSSISSNLV